MMGRKPAVFRRIAAFGVELGSVTMIGTWLDSGSTRVVSMTHQFRQNRRLDGRERALLSADDLRGWLREHPGVPERLQEELIQAVEQVLARQRQLIEESKHEAIRALSEGFAAKMDRLQTQLTEKDVTVSNIARYFEEVVADLTERSHRDPKTKLLNFDWFMERLESFLAVEQRVRWCAVGVVDITSFKHYNDTLGHAAGDRIIERVARILADQIRSEDFLAVERAGQGRDLHARFGGDEFCFLIPDLPGCNEASDIAGRFKDAVGSYDWTREDQRLAAHPVMVDVGVVCLQLGAATERRGVARALAAELIHRADQLMYEAKSAKASTVYAAAVRIDQGELVDIPEAFVPCPQSPRIAEGGR
jgi:diguanylate cyclase (GGDEF)-like protein